MLTPLNVSLVALSYHLRSSFKCSVLHAKGKIYCLLQSIGSLCAYLVCLIAKGRIAWAYLAYTPKFNGEIGSTWVTVLNTSSFSVLAHILAFEYS